MKLLNNTQFMEFIFIEFSSEFLVRISIKDEWIITSTTSYQLLFGVSRWTRHKAILGYFSITSVIETDNIEEIQYVPALVEHIYSKNRSNLIFRIFKCIQFHQAIASFIFPINQEQAFETKIFL